MFNTRCAVSAHESPAPNIFVVSVHSPEIASAVKPGQFINVKVADGPFPLLRRPFSVYRVHDEEAEIIFDVRGIGTRILASKRTGDQLDIIGPLGRPYKVDDAFDTAILVGGGLGVAPLPMITLALKAKGRAVATFLGARTRSLLVDAHLENISVSTDDGSAGFKGTVVDLLRSRLRTDRHKRAKIFACGPNPMLRSLSLLAAEYEVPCEISLESPMGCGVGICQGCPVALADDGGKYALICRDGAVFDSRKVRIA
jgi:dihydroorotate dehydrogenase electron transfer subunit